MEALIYDYIKQHKNTLLILVSILLLTIVLQYSQNLFKKEISLSLDQMIPKGFVLIPIEIHNSSDVLPLIGSYGVVDLYSYSSYKNLPEDIVALSLKIIPPLKEDSRFSAIIPEKEVSQLFQHSGPFYAVIQNPQKQGSQIIKRKVRKPLVVIEEKEQNENS